MNIKQSTWMPEKALQDVTTNPISAPAKPGRLLRLPAVMERCGLGRSSIYAGVKNGTFPAPVRLLARAIAWREEDTDKWVSERVTTGGQS